MILTGQQLINRGVVVDGVREKVDDGRVPSWGADGALYTFRGHIPDLVRVVLQPGELSRSIPTVEAVDMPTDCVGLLYAKSTYARRGLVLVTNTPVDPGYRGQLSMRFLNSGDGPVTLDLRGGLMQMVVHMLTSHVLPYNGRWQQ